MGSRTAAGGAAAAGSQGTAVRPEGLLGSHQVPESSGRACRACCTGRTGRGCSPWAAGSACAGNTERARLDRKHQARRVDLLLIKKRVECN